MIRLENIETWGFEHAIRGMRNPMNSWDKSDSDWEDGYGDDEVESSHFHYFGIGDNDLRLMQSLYAGGTSHRKYLRQIFVSLDITAPLYWWKEFDTYKVGTVANSCSTMHRIQAKVFELNDFSHEHLTENMTGLLSEIVRVLNIERGMFNATKDKKHWWQMIQLLPSSYNQRRTVTMSYENVMNMLDTRMGHKLDEWREFCKTMRELPYIADIRRETEVNPNGR